MARMPSMTSGMGSVCTSPDMYPPMPCTRSGLAVITVPAPSHTVTAASIIPAFIPVIMDSEAPNPTKVPIFSLRRGENIPWFSILNSILAAAD